MRCFGRGRKGIKADQLRALRHPTRIRILEVVAHEKGKRLSVEELTEALVRTPGFEHVEPSTVTYHCARLLDAKLLPAK